MAGLFPPYGVAFPRNTQSIAASNRLVWRKNPSPLVTFPMFKQGLASKLGHDLADRTADGQVRLRAGKLGLVDDHQLVPTVVPHQPRRRVHRQGGATDDEDFRMADSGHRRHEDLLVQPLLIEDHVGLDDPAAAAPGDTGAVCNGLHAVKGPAGLAVVPQHAAVELQHPAAPGLLVEAVDVLGDHRLQLPRRLPLRQLPVGGVGLGVQEEHFVPVEAEELLRVPLKEGVAQDGLRRVGVLLVVEPPGAPEVRNAGLRADAGAAEEDDAAALLHPFS